MSFQTRAPIYFHSNVFGINLVILMVKIQDCDGLIFDLSENHKVINGKTMNFQEMTT